MIILIINDLCGIKKHKTTVNDNECTRQLHPEQDAELISRMNKAVTMSPPRKERQVSTYG
jgi:hypothetical protein